MEKYVKVRKIGQGSFGCAYLATRKAGPGTTCEQFVIKEILLDPRDHANAEREARLLAALDHPNIITCKESFFLTPSPVNAAFLGRQQRPTVLCIVTEFADGGDLSHECERRARRRDFFQPDELLGLFVQVCLALKHLHDRKILHRDVKPANIFLTQSGVVKLGDLGVATVLSHTLASAQTSIGTPYYTAPEICLGKRYNAKADVWSLGCVLFEMVSFTRAFQGRSQRQLFENIIHKVTPELPFCTSLNSIKRELQTLVDEMLHKEPRARPSVNQLIRHPLVLARIQTFLSARALASELNHTVLHGHNVFEKTVVKDRVCPIADGVRHAAVISQKLKSCPRQRQQQVKKTPNGRVGALLGASRKARGHYSNALRRSQKRPQPARVAARIPAVNNLNVAKRVVPVRTRAQVTAKLNEAVAALPDPPTVLKVKAAKAHDGVSERVAAFNTKWAVQKERLVPPPAPRVVKKIVDSKKSKQAARAYPKPVILGVTGQPLDNNKQAPPPPAPVGIRCPPTKQKTRPKAPGPILRDNPSLRERRLEFQRKKQAERGSKPHTTQTSPLDDPVILVQQLPDVKTSLAPKLLEPVDQVPLSPPPANSDSIHFQDEEDHDLTSLPVMANLEFQRMILQLKSVVVSDLTTSYDDDNSEEVLDPDLPPPYSTTPVPSIPLETLSISVLEDPTFRLALEKRLQQQQLKAPTTEQIPVVLDPTQQAILTWMHIYITSLL